MKLSKIFKSTVSITLSLAIIATMFLVSGVVVLASENMGYYEFIDGDFESGSLEFWNAGNAYSVVSATDEGLIAPSGNKIMKIDNTKVWSTAGQKVAVEKNTEYILSFWVYRVDSTSTAWIRIPNISEGGNIKDDLWLNNETPGQWVKKEIKFNSGNAEILKAHFTAYSGSATYIDDIQINAHEYNFKNGSFETDEQGWTIGRVFSMVNAADEGIPENHGDKILKINTKENDWVYNISHQTIELKDNTDYILSFWVYRVDSTSTSWFNVANPDTGVSLIKDRWLNNENPGEWVEQEIKFNSSDFTTLKLSFTSLSGSNTYIDNVRIKKEVEVSAISDENGTVSGLSEKVYKGDTVSLTAKANAGYLFEGWYVGSSKVSSIANYSFVAKGNINLVAKFVVENPYNELLDGDFESGSLELWSAGNGYTVVSSTEDLAAPSGDKFMKIDNSNTWSTAGQKATVEKNTDYLLSFWVYRVDSTSTAWIRIPNISEGGNIKDDIWLNNETPGQWVKKEIKFNSGNAETVKVHFTAYSGSATYIDNIELRKSISVSATVNGNGTVSGLAGAIYNGDEVSLNASANIGSLFDGWYVGEEKISSNNIYSFTATDNIALVAKFKVENPYSELLDGDFESGSLELWNAGGAYTVVDAADADLTAPSGNKIMKIDNSKQWSTAGQTAIVEKNTDYLLSFWVYRADSTSTAWIRIPNITEGGNIKDDLWLNNETPETWVKKEIKFNSGNAEAVKAHFTAYSGSATYIDNIELRKSVTVTVEAVGGSVTGYDREIYKGDTVELSVIADAGHIFDGWYNLENKLSDNIEYQFTAEKNEEIIAKFIIKAGNVNGDDAINSLDTAALRQYLMGSVDSVLAGDVNEDGSIDARDIVNLKKKLAF